jgi:hypothetical protein
MNPVIGKDTEKEGDGPLPGATRPWIITPMHPIRAGSDPATMPGLGRGPSGYGLSGLCFDQMMITGIVEKTSTCIDQARSN